MSVDTFIANLNLPEEADRMYAAEDLGFANESAGITPLCDRLRVEPSRAVKEAIITALGRIRHSQVVAELASLLQNEDPFICNQAVQLLAGWGSDAIPQIQDILSKGDDHARKLALDALGGIQVPGVEKLYRMALQDPNPNIVITAVEHIGLNAVKSLKVEIESIFKEVQEPMLLTAVLETLCLMGDADSLNLILERFQDISAVPEMLQYSIIKATGLLGDLRHAPRVIGLLQTGHECLAQPVVDALISLRARVSSPPWPEDLLNPLLGVLNRNIADVLRYQILVLLWQGQHGAEFTKRLDAEVQRLKDPELLQALAEQMNKPCAL